MRYLLAFVLLLSLPRLGQAQVAIVWDNSYGSARNEIRGYTVAMPAGGYLLLSGVEDVGSPPPSLARFLFFVRTNAVGDTMWTKKMTPHRTFQPAPTGILIDNTGNVLVTGTENGGNGYGFFLKLTPTCDTVWTKQNHYVGPGNSIAAYDSPMLTPDGNYTVCAGTTLFGLGAPIHEQHLVKINAATGSKVSEFSFTNAFSVNGLSIYSYVASTVKTPTGFLSFVIGANQAGISNIPATIAVSENGTLTRLKKRVSPGTNSLPVAAATADGNVVVGRRQMATKLTALGDTLWHTVVPRRLGRDWDATSLCEDAQANVVVAANSFVNVGPGVDAINVHFIRFRRQTGQVVNDTMLFRPGRTWVSTVLRAANGNLVIGGWHDPGFFGGSDAYLAEWSAFRLLAARAGAGPLAAEGLQVYPNPAAGPAATLRLPETSRAGGTVQVYDGLGRRHGQVTAPPGAAAVALPLGPLPPGLYLLRFDGRDGARLTTRLVRE